MSTDIEYVPWPKISRRNRTVFVTEKIDGTNACVHISEDGVIRAGSRTRWITPEDDNFGFAKWVQDNQGELLKLGAGAHFGEWYGRGVQRNYGLTERRFALFNASHWGKAEDRPECCHVVPLLAIGLERDGIVEQALERLRAEGSIAVPGFKPAEGIIIYHTASKQMNKITLEKDESPKGASE